MVRSHKRDASNGLPEMVSKSPRVATSTMRLKNKKERNIMSDSPSFLPEFLRKRHYCPRVRRGYKCHRFSAAHNYKCEEKHFLRIKQVNKSND